MAGDIEENVEITVTGAEQLQAAADAAEELDNRVKAARDAIAEMDQTAAGSEEIAAMLEQADAAAEQLAEGLASARDRALEFTEANADVAGTSEAASAAMEQQAAATETLAEAEARMRDAVYEANPGIDDQTASLLAEAAAAGAAGLGLEEYAAQARLANLEGSGLEATLLRLRDELGGSGIGDTFTATRTGWNQFMVTAPAELEETAAALENTGWSAEQAAAEIQALGLDSDEAFLLGKAAADSYRDSLMEIATALAAVDAEAAATIPELAAMGAEEAGDAAGGGGGILGGIGNALGAVGGAAGSWLLSKWKIPALVTGIAGLIGGIEPALMAVGSGFVSFAALAAPALEKVVSGWEAVSQAQAAYRTAQGVYQRDPTSSNLTAERNALAALQTTWAGLPAPIRAVITEGRNFETEWKRVAAASGIEGDAIRDFGLALKTASDFLPSVVTMARAAAPVISGLWTDLDRNVKSSQFKSFVGDMAKDVKPAAQGFHEIASAVGGWFDQMQSRGSGVSTEFLDQLAHMLKEVTPASVTGFLDAAKLLTHAFSLIGDLGNQGTRIGRVAADVGGFVRDTVGVLERGGPDIAHAAGGFLGWVERISRDMTPAELRGPASGGGWTPFVHVHVRPLLDFSQPSYDAQSLRAALDRAREATGAAAGAKVSVPLDPKVTAPDLQHSLDQATQQVKIHGATVDLADARLSGLSALAGTMSQAGKLAGTDMDRALASAITSGSAAAVGDARKMGTEIRAALAPVPGELHSIGVAAGEGMASGIEASTGAAVAAAEHMAAAVEAAARVKLQTQSPSKVFAKIGAETVAGFVAGLLGGEGQVRAALAAILGHAVNDLKIAQAIDKMRTEVQAALRAGVITAAQESEYTGWLREDNRRLQRLASERASLEKQIKAADALAASVRSEAISEGSVTSAYGETWAGKAGAGQSPTYRTVNQALKAQLEQTREFRADIAKLKKEGLDENSIRALLAEGVTAGLPQAEELLASGRGGIRETAKLEKEIAAAAKRLGITGANASYESGKDIGKGLAEGLRSQLGEIEAEMKKIADELVAAIRRALRISSPSQVMREIGQMAAAGVVQGADDYQALIRAAGNRMAAALWTHHPVAEPMGFGAGGGYAAPQPIIIDLTVVSELDGRVVSRSVQKFTLQRARRNISSGLVLRGRAA